MLLEGYILFSWNGSFSFFRLVVLVKSHATRSFVSRCEDGSSWFCRSDSAGISGNFVDWQISILFSDSQILKHRFANSIALKIVKFG